jgi:glutaredoxin
MWHGLLYRRKYHKASATPLKIGRLGRLGRKSAVLAVLAENRPSYYMACLGNFPYFAYQDLANHQNASPVAETLGQGGRPDAPMWLHRSVPKGIKEGKRDKKKGTVLVGYYLKHVVTSYRSHSQEAVLFVKDKAAFKEFMKKYGITVGFVDWDRVAADWGGVEFGSPFLPGWSNYEVAIWSPEVIKRVELCEEGKPQPIFVVYTLSYCPYCHELLDKLDKMQIPHLNYTVAESEKERLKTEHGWPTFPHVFIIGADGQRYFLGGNDEFDEFLKALI